MNVSYLSQTAKVLLFIQTEPQQKVLVTQILPTGSEPAAATSNQTSAASNKTL